MICPRFLRMYPVVPMNARVIAEKDVTIGGYQFAKKVDLLSVSCEYVFFTIITFLHSEFRFFISWLLPPPPRPLSHSATTPSATTRTRSRSRSPSSRSDGSVTAARGHTPSPPSPSASEWEAASAAGSPSCRCTWFCSRYVTSGVYVITHVDVM